MAHKLLVQAAQHLAQARAIKDEFDGKDMPAEAARQMQAHLSKASELRGRVTREVQLADNESWLSEPDYKHDMGAGGERVAGEFGHGTVMLDSERKAAAEKSFFDFVRKGDRAIAPEVKADLIEDSTGEVIIPVDFAGTILKELPREAVIRALAFVRPTSSNRVDVGSVLINQASWGRLELGDANSDGLGSPPADSDQIRVWNLNALVKVGVDELEDSDENLAEIIRSALVLKIAEQEDDAFAAGVGDAQKRPTGIVSTAGGVTQGVIAAAGETVVADDLKKLKYRVPAQFRRNGRYLGHTSAEEAVSLLKDANGNYIWQPRVSEDEPARLFGHPWHTVDGLPAMSAVDDAGAGTNPSVVFGDVRSGYMVADRRRLTVTRLSELYAGEGKVGLLFTHRVGGGVIRPKAFATYKL